MKRKLLLIPFIAVLTFMLVAPVYAGELANGVVTEFNGITLDNTHSGSQRAVVGMVGETVPVRVIFNAIRDMSDVRVEIRMEGHREDISAQTDRFDIISGVTYSKLLNLQLPSDEHDLSDNYNLYVEISSNEGRTEEVYKIVIQRESYTLEVLSVDYSSSVSAGTSAPISIVVKNNGYNVADDVYAVVSIPELGISSRTYLGDLLPIDSYLGNDGEEDSVYQTAYLQIPENAKSGVYEMFVEVYNDDSSVTVSKLISVGDSGYSEVLAGIKNMDLKAGETVTYDLVLVNSGNSLKIFNLAATSGDSLIVNLPGVVAVGPQSSETVKITVTASSDAKVGTYTFSVDANGKQVVFGANVVGKGTSANTSTIALAVVLVIIFVVLLIVLAVLLARKERPIEEVETSYY